VAQLYPQALGSLFVASYDSQGYGGDPPSLTRYVALARTAYKTPLPTFPLLLFDVTTDVTT
jgi:hypothetical protein